MASLKSLIIEYHVSLYKLSKDTGIPYSTLSDLVAEITPLESTSSGTLYRLAKYFEVSMESLLENHSPETIIIYNDKRNIHITCGSVHIQYLGPKNLISFKQINRLVGKTVYIDTYFRHENGSIFAEEDYIDLQEIFDEYKHTVHIDENTVIKLGSGKAYDKIRLIDESLMVSDSMAIKLADSSTSDVILQIVSLNRMHNSLTLRLKDYAVLSTNMSRNMQKRAIESVERNHDLILSEIEGETRANA